MRGRFDVTAFINPGQANALAVRIIRVANPGSTKDKAGPTVNGGALGRDNPTFHASAGWDWMSTIRGRDTGIWNNVSLTRTGAVQIEDPLVTTKLPLPDITHADVTIEATLRNLESSPVSGILQASFGDITVSESVTLEGNSARTVQLSPTTQPRLRLEKPKLWWPVGYGDPNLYPVSIRFVADGVVSDQTSFNAGVRQFTYSEDGDVLKIRDTPDIMDVVRSSQSSLQNIDTLVRRVDRIVSFVESGQGSIGHLIYDQSLYNRLNATLTEVQNMVNQIRYTNKLIKEAIEKNNSRYYYVNIFDRMLDANGHPIKDLFDTDGLHLSKKGYILWKEVLQEHLSSNL